MTTRQTFDPLEYYFKLCKDVDDELQDQLVMHMIHNGYIGEENRVTREQLSIALLGEFTQRTDRMIRKAKEELLKKGMLILSSSGTAGYYLPAFQDEVDEYIRENTNRIHALLQNVRMAKQVRLPYRQPDHVRQLRFLEVR